MKEQRLSQAQITNILKNCLFKTYDQHLEYGSAKYDVIKFIGGLSAVTGQQFYRLKINTNGIKEFVARVQPLLKDLAQKDFLSEDIFEDFRGRFERKVSEQISLSNGDHPEGKVKEKVVVAPDLAQKNVIPMGLEEGVPLVSPETFFKFPFAAEEEDPDEENLFAQHWQYLDLLKDKKRVNSEVIQGIKELLPAFPQYRYEKYFDIFPFGVFDDGVLMIIYRLWKRKRLEPIRVKN